MGEACVLGWGKQKKKHNQSKAHSNSPGTILIDIVKLEIILNPQVIEKCWPYCGKRRNRDDILWGLCS